MILSKNLKKIMVFVLITIVSGSVWGAVYLLFAKFHGMDKMFNSEYMFFTSKIVGLQVSSLTMGFVLTFIDGAIFGAAFSYAIYILIRFISK